jgi:hypothetical protein
MRVDGKWLKDEAGRTLILRGVNLGGSSKVPAAPDGATWRPDGLREPAAVSFVGRPFPIEEADAHFARLAGWGFTFLRFVITWEAVEHAGPGAYDEAYLAYVRKLLKKAEAHGIRVFIDPHQDVWSRWTGGDGAPAWTLEKLGMDLGRLAAVGAALTHQEHGDPYPRMAWPTNYNRYAAATLFTLFFAGNAYAPGVAIDGESAQDWLQAKFLAAMRHTYRRLKDCAAIVGWGTFNEPHPGYAGYRDLDRLENCQVAVGPLPSGFQGMAAASGHPVGVPVYAVGAFGTRRVGKKVLNPEGLSLFKPGFACPWKRAGVWTDEGGPARLLRPDHFAAFDGRPVNFADDFLKPFQRRMAALLREVKPDALVFIEGLTFGDQPHPSWNPADGAGFVNAFHCYDGAALFTKSYSPHFSIRSDTRRPLFGRKAVAAGYRAMVAEGTRWAEASMAGMPCLLGEFGLPFDINGRRAYRDGDYRRHEAAFANYYDAVDALLLHSTLWNFTAGNTNARGDGWNDEDLSIWAEGAPRAIDGWRRPYPESTAGEPLRIRWDTRGRRFEYVFRADPDPGAPTVIFAPAECFGGSGAGSAPRAEATDPAGAAIPGALWAAGAAPGRLELSLPGYRGEVRVLIWGTARA